jgi:hypothetical protein
LIHREAREFRMNERIFGNLRLAISKPPNNKLAVR